MSAEFFIDTNVFLYSIDDSVECEPKRTVAREILENQRWGWSVQVAAEFFVNATSPKRSFRLNAGLASALVENWFSFPTVEITPEIVRTSISLHQRYQTSYWDSAILASARILGCHTVYTEDMNHGQDYDGVKVKNPFLLT